MTWSSGLFFYFHFFIVSVILKVSLHANHKSYLTFPRNKLDGQLPQRRIVMRVLAFYMALKKRI